MSLNKTFEGLRDLFEEVLKLKNSGTDHIELAEKRKYALLMFVLIKKLNRTEKYGIRSGREELHRTKVQVDSNRLQLQNLLYEVGYLRREIRNCYQFKSQDEDIDLLPEQDYASLVKSKVDNEAAVTTKHEKRLLRLEGELNLRKNLSVQCKDLANSKKQVLQDIVLKMERLTSFAPSLRTLAKATRPLQEALQTPLEREWRLGRLVQLLPQALYVAYMHVHAFEPEVTVAIVGTEKDVHDIEVSGQLENLKELENAQQTELTEERLMDPHPLTVQFSINNKQNERESIVINLRYFPRLGFATAASTLQLDDVDSEFATTQDILQTLYDGDSGDAVPISKTVYELKKFNISPEKCLEQLSSKGLGKPYRWVQRICSIEAYAHANREGTEVKLQEIIANTVKSIQSAWNSRLNLLRQIRALVSKNTDLYLKDEQLPVAQPTCSLVQWTTVSWDEFQTHNDAEAYVQCGLVDANYTFYRAVVVRGSAKMECLISIPTKFPDANPIWIISVYWNGQHNAGNSAAVKQMEALTNSLCQAQVQNEYALLAFQLYHTMYSFDIFLETEGPLYNPVEYSKEKHYIKAFTKRIRARPYRFIKEGATCSFKQ